LAHTIVIGPLIALMARRSAEKAAPADVYPVAPLNQLDSAT